MEVNQKELIYILESFLVFMGITKHCGQNDIRKSINEFIEERYPALYNGEK